MTALTFADVSRYAPAAGVLVGFPVLGLLVLRALLPRLARLASRSSWRVDDYLIDAVRWPLVAWFALGGVAAAARLLPLSPRGATLITLATVVAGILSVTWALSRFATLVVRGAAAGGAQSVSLLAGIARWTVIVVGLLVALQTLGVRVTPLITALGIGGLAVGLALQDTLSNIFAGLRILGSRKIRPGDFVRLETGQDGWVMDIAWGQTTIRQGQGNIVIVPNAKLAQAVTVNYSLPSPEQLFAVVLTVAHGSDLEAVELAAVECARAAMRAAPEGSPDFEPVVRFMPFSDAGHPFTVVLKARTFPDHVAVQHEFLKRLAARFRADGITLGVPERRMRTEPEAGS